MLCSYPFRQKFTVKTDLTSIDMMLTIKSLYKKSITVHDDGAFIVIMIVNNYYFYISLKTASWYMSLLF